VIVPWSPYWEHIKEAWEKRDEENLLFLFYEDLVNVCFLHSFRFNLKLNFQDMPTCIRKVSQFLGKPISEEDVAKMANHLHIDNFRNNASTNLDAENLFGMRVEGEPGFIRKGTILNN
jgi:sulfotransferase